MKMILLPLDLINLILSFLSVEEDIYLLQFKPHLVPCYKINWKAEFFLSLSALQHVRFIYPLYTSSATTINNRSLYKQSKQYYETVISKTTQLGPVLLLRKGDST